MLLMDRDASSDLRIREVVKLERTTGGGELLANATVNVVGKAKDGVVDLVPYQILVEGIPESQQDAAIIQFTVDGYSSTPQAVTIGERVGDTGWRLTGQIPYIDVEPEQTVEMLATVQLPEGGTSEHRVSVNLKAGEEPKRRDLDRRRRQPPRRQLAVRPGARDARRDGYVQTRPFHDRRPLQVPDGHAAAP